MLVGSSVPAIDGEHGRRNSDHRTDQEPDADRADGKPEQGAEAHAGKQDAGE
jgi:hypothetical protein